MTRIEALNSDTPGRHQSNGTTAFIPAPSRKPAPEKATDGNTFIPVAHVVWRRHQRSEQLDAARAALVAAGMPVDHPHADALAEEVLAHTPRPRPAVEQPATPQTAPPASE
ncbi:MAG: hypothetical protein HOQ05_12300 [Corynebacteriales bacterium]|nr:hypothetical protein [Mycobacteriales bacterium]